MDNEREYYVIVTKYGFVYDVHEDYSDIDEQHELYCLANVSFTDVIKRADIFRSKEDSAPKYAVSREHDYRELTVDKWTKEINGELIKVKMISFDNLIPSNKNLELQETTKYIVEDSQFFKGNFPLECFDVSDLFLEEEN